MESFLDEYQTVRLWSSGLGLVFLAATALIGDWAARNAAITIVLIVVGGHAGWCRLRQVRSPRSMLAVDVTLFGGIMILLSDAPGAITAVGAILALMIVLFTEGAMLAGLLAYLLGWYIAAYFTGHVLSQAEIENFMASVVPVSTLAAVMYRVRGWLGRLEANRSQMLGVVSHELKNNLTGILGLTEVVARGEGLNDADSRRLSRLAHQQAIDATGIIEDLLTVSRIENSALSVTMERVDVNSEVANTVRRFQTEARVRIGAGELPEVSADPLRLRQILRNLLSNAVRYGGDQIAVVTRTVGSAVEIVVSDDGDGVPPSDEDTIFLPYRRSTDTRRHAASVGLGLWICHRLAEEMGGTLRYARVDNATQFVLRLGPHPAPERVVLAGADVAGS